MTMALLRSEPANFFALFCVTYILAKTILGFSDEEIKRFHKLLKSVEFLIYCKIQKSNAQDEECEG